MNLLPHQKIIMDKMATFVALKSFDDVDASDPHWFHGHTWSRQKEQEFKDWLISYLASNKHAFHELSNGIWRNKKNIAKLADDIIFMWGWKTEKE